MKFDINYIMMLINTKHLFPDFDFTGLYLFRSVDGIATAAITPLTDIRISNCVSPKHFYINNSPYLISEYGETYWVGAE